MDTVLNSLLYDWTYPVSDRDRILRGLEDYRRTERELEKATDALKQTLSAEQLHLLGRYSDALVAAESLAATASMLTGARMALRLSLALLTA